MNQKRLLLIGGLLMTLTVGLFAQTPGVKGNSRVPRYTSVDEHKYEHVMFLTCTLFESDDAVANFEVGVFDRNGECRGSAISKAESPHVAYVTIHGTSGLDEGMTVKVVYGDGNDLYKYERVVEHFTINMLDNKAIGNTRLPYELIVSADPSFSWSVGNGTLKQGIPSQLSATLLTGATRLDLRGAWTASDLQKLKGALPKTTLQTLNLSRDFGHIDLSGMLSGCKALTATTFRAMPTMDVAHLFDGTNPNNIIYVPVGTTSEDVPATWKNVACGSEQYGYEALTDFVLQGSAATQTCPFACAHDIALNGHTAMYTPVSPAFAHQKGNWNSLVLPFDADVYADDTKLQPNRDQYATPDSYWLMMFNGNHGDEVSFYYAYETNGVKAHTPCLIALPGAAHGTNSLVGKKITFRSNGTVIKAVPHKIWDESFANRPQSVEFLGTYQGVQGKAYNLQRGSATSGNADTFVYSEQASVLPFTAYMTLSTATATPAHRVLKISCGSVPSGIIPVENNQEADVVYDLMGRKVINFNDAVPGIYIVNGRKHIKH